MVARWLGWSRDRCGLELHHQFHGYLATRRLSCDIASSRPEGFVSMDPVLSGGSGRPTSAIWPVRQSKRDPIGQEWSNAGCRLLLHDNALQNPLASCNAGRWEMDTGGHNHRPRAVISLRNAAGLLVVHFRKARWKALGSEKPRRVAISPTPNSVVCSISIARSRRISSLMAA